MLLWDIWFPIKFGYGPTHHLVENLLGNHVKEQPNINGWRYMSHESCHRHIHLISLGVQRPLYLMAFQKSSDLKSTISEDYSFGPVFDLRGDIYIYIDISKSGLETAIKSHCWRISVVLWHWNSSKVLASAWPSASDSSAIPAAQKSSKNPAK